MIEHARRRNWFGPATADFDFALVYGDHEGYSRQVSHIRRMRARELLRTSAGSLDARLMTRLLRDHYEGTFLDELQFHPFLPEFHTLCMHESPSGFTWGNTATSLVVELNADRTPSPLVWVCYQPPCSSAYFPCGVGVPLPALLTATGTAGPEVRAAPEAPMDAYHEDSLWWRLRRLIDQIRADPIPRSEQARRQFDAAEDDFFEQAASVPDEPVAARRRALETATREQVDHIAGIVERPEQRWS